MAPLRMWYIVTLTYMFKVKISGNNIFNIWKTARGSEKCSSTTFIEVDISHRMKPLKILYIVTLTFIFKVTQFLEIIIYTISKTVTASKNCTSTTFKVDIRCGME